MPLKWIPRSKSGASKSRPRWAAHTRIGNVWEYPPPPRQNSCLLITVHSMFNFLDVCIDVLNVFVAGILTPQNVANYSLPFGHLSYNADKW